MTSSLLIVLVVVLVILVTPIGLYNGLVGRRNAVDNAFSSLDANLQKRFDLVPNLVATVRGYMTHERDTLEAITQLRGQALQVGTPQARLQNDSALAPLVGQVMAIAESYPQLSASGNFLLLQRSLNEIEEQISASRRAFNASVNDYNTAIETFPGSMIASMFGFARRDFFAAGDASRQAPDLTGQFT